MQTPLKKGGGKKAIQIQQCGLFSKNTSKVKKQVADWENILYLCVCVCIYIYICMYVYIRKIYT